MRSLATLAAFAMTISTAFASPRAAAVLMAEDGDFTGHETTERLGIALYGRFLESGPYAEVSTLTGREGANERLAAAICAAAARNDVVDVFLSVHTTRRDPGEWLRLIPPEARKLRLVYSTACYGNDEERAAWERVGARGIVTHVGINNPLVAMPYFLSRWIDGLPLGPAVAESYREGGIATRFALSLPGAAEGAGSVFGTEFLAGSRPVVTGDVRLTIDAGLEGVAPRCPRNLRYDRETGGIIGLWLRALAGRFTVSGDEVRGVLGRLGMPLPLPKDALEQVEKLYVDDDGELCLRLRDDVDIPLEQGIRLRLRERVKIRPGRVDPVARTVQLHVSGVWIKKGIISVRVTKLTVLPDPEGPGYRLRANAGLWGFIPVRKTFPIGGTTPDPVPDDGPLYRERVEDTTGLLSAIPGG